MIRKAGNPDKHREAEDVKAYFEAFRIENGPYQGDDEASDENANLKRYRDPISLAAFPCIPVEAHARARDDVGVLRRVQQVRHVENHSAKQGKRGKEEANGAVKN